MKYHLLGVLLLALLGCGIDDLLPPAAPPTLPLPPGLAILSGNSQQGTSGEFLTEPFVVRVTDEQGNGVLSAQVRWTVASGVGELSGTTGRFQWPPEVTPTAGNGVASMSFRPLLPGRTEVIAEVDGVQGSPATFTVTATGPNVLVIHFGPVMGCPDMDPSYFTPIQGAVPVGTLVEWEVWSWVAPCTAQVRSVSVPPGGIPFESGILKPGDRFGVVLGVAGEWTVQDVINGGAVTLRVH